ncbi:malonyl-CoA decarboxylase [Hwanghaeella grinnelliae]|uniref:Malonyl-CoA decarboxylase n=1 Tax=Hwanghaeella grinnelliae TaxID=2500179 RepID=A0A437QKE9_9PROT|nr:malonyl-CoA decarboxylase [Hwanghaeella grinnelliae]RVU34993.1 malonyl-CoA decarboxylase [Hwanghaeella grinnelliae]
MSDIAAQPQETLWTRTVNSVRRVWLDLGATLDSDAIPAKLEGKAADQLLERMRACIASEGGEVSARARAAQLGQYYMGLDAPGRKRFLEILASNFGPDKEKVETAIEAYHHAAPEKKARARQDLQAVLTPPRQSLLTQFNALPDGVKFLVDLRAELLRYTKESPELADLDKDLERLLVSWFDIGFLELQRITWNSPAALLEKLISYEAVHEIRSWTDLRNRLDSDRRLFAFFHPRMPMEPLIFVEVALVNGIAGSIQTLLDEDAPIVDPNAADTAIFYSISNTQRGLRGISFGNFLIKRVVEELKAEFPNLKAFSTLSPIPMFRQWLESNIAEGDPNLLTAEDRKRLKKVTGNKFGKGDLLRSVTTGDWVKDAELSEALRPALLRLCARYLVQEKRKERPLDPVARFHLSNGAQVERVNWLGDISDKGMRESAGMMVNYLYRLNDIEKNHERFAKSGFVATSSGVRGLL